MIRILQIFLLSILWLCGTGVAQASDIPAGRIQEARLDNGLRVLLIESHNIPMLAMQLVLPAGSRLDPSGQAGTAAMLAAMLSDHTRRHDHESFDAWLDREAIHLGAGVSRDAMTLSLTVLRDVLPQGLDALAEALLQPGWDKQRLRQLRRDAIAAATKAMEEPGYRAAQRIGATLYGEHPYAHRPDGDAESLARITMDGMRRLYRRQCLPQGAVLAVSGDITLQQLLPMLEKRFGAWHGVPEIAFDAIEAVTPQAPQRHDISMPTTQTLVQFARLGIARGDADFFPALVLNHLLGGSGFGSVLMEEVREKRGLVYGIYSYLQPMMATGPFVISLQTRADQAKEAERIVRMQLQRLAMGQIDAKRLQAIKDNLTGGFAQRMDSNRERVGLVAMIGLYRLPLDYLQNWTQRVASVKLADVERVAQRLLPPDDWSVIRVGPIGDEK